MKILNKKMTRMGNSYGFLVPAAFISNGQLSPSKEYNIELKEVVDREASA